MTYVLHYAPDNASLVVRLALEELCLPYQTALVDRRAAVQHSAAYKELNPVGRIPALVTPDGPIFETAAICLRLADRHRDTVRLSPGPDDPARGAFLSWLFFLSNTVHAELRTLFHASKTAGPDLHAQQAVTRQTQENLAGHFELLNTRYTAPAEPDLCAIYLAVLLRWPALYPIDADRSWVDLSRWPKLQALARRIEARDSARAAILAEGLGPTPFSDPCLPTAPEGSAL